MQGSIKFYNDQKGFGFVVTESGEDLFFHISQCDEAYEMPAEGDVVSYELGEGRDGRPVAVNVTFVSAGSAEGGEEAQEEETQEEEAQEE